MVGTLMQLLAGLLQETTKSKSSSFRDPPPAHHPQRISHHSGSIDLCSLGTCQMPKMAIPPMPSQHADKNGSNCKGIFVSPVTLISVHEQPLSSRVRWLWTHRALTDLLRLLTAAANHVATGDQRHTRTMLVANGAVDLSASRRGLLQAASCHFCCL